LSLSDGLHSFRISGINKGIYLLKVTSKNINYSAKLIGQNSNNGSAKIEYVTTLKNNAGSQLKNTSGIVDLPYSEGDILLYTSTTGQYSTIITDAPTTSKTITFDFSACIDADENTYTTVTIGNQVWMAENLKTTKYNDGSSVPLIIDNLEWGNLSTPGYCWYNNDETTNKNVCGALYNWHTVNTGKLAPVGWHVPDYNEWQSLANYLGRYLVAGGKLKESGSTHWLSPNEGATNESGFSALPAGYRWDFDNSFIDKGICGVWWSSTDSNASIAWYRLAHHSNAVLPPGIQSKNAGFSVRCVRNIIGASVPPVVTTSPVTNITLITATCGGDVSSDGGDSVISRGVCWNTNGFPTIQDNKTIDGKGLDVFSGNLTELEANTRYYVRAYATNSIGTSYGTERMFTTTSGTSSTGTFKDERDGQTYKWVQIGSQVWMAENLAYLPSVNPPTEINYSDSRYYVYGYNGINVEEAKALDNYKQFGVLYNEPAAKVACPIGWHIPSKEEWDTLAKFISNDNELIGKVGGDYPYYWDHVATFLRDCICICGIQDRNGKDKYGFNALLAGRLAAHSLSFENINSDAIWRTTTSVTTTTPIQHVLMSQCDSSPHLYFDGGGADYGFSVRCVKD
jgi:uncharacterized protein (TIGR02145 family)